MEHVPITIDLITLELESSGRNRLERDVSTRAIIGVCCLFYFPPLERWKCGMRWCPQKSRRKSEMDRIDKETRAKRKKSPGDRRVGGRSSRVKSRWRGVRRSLGLHAPTLSNAATSVEFSSACPPSSIFESCPLVPRRLTSCPPVEIRFRSWNRPHRTKKEGWKERVATEERAAWRYLLAPLRSTG